MNILQRIIKRAPLLSGMVLMQSPTLPNLGEQIVNEQIVTALANAPAYISIIFMVIAFLMYGRQQQKFFADQQRFAADAAERRDKILSDAMKEGREASASEIMALQRENQEKEKREQENEKSRIEAMKLLAINVGDSNRLVEALDERGAFMLTARQEDAQVLQAIEKTSVQTYNFLLTKFPGNESVNTHFDELKRVMIAAIEKACAKHKGDTGPLPPITLPQEVTVTLHTPAPDGGTAGESEAA